jgi:hypothetical protein
VKKRNVKKRIAYNISKSFSTLLLAGAIVELLNTAQI